MNFDNTVRYIKLRNANHKPENGIEIESKFFSTGYRNVFRRVVCKGDRFEKKCFFKIDPSVNNLDRGANNFIQYNTDNLFEPARQDQGKLLNSS